jgi:hypothetical protein
VQELLDTVDAMDTGLFTNNGNGTGNKTPFRNRIEDALDYMGSGDYTGNSSSAVSELLFLLTKLDRDQNDSSDWMADDEPCGDTEEKEATRATIEELIRRIESLDPTATPVDFPVVQECPPAAASSSPGNGNGKAKGKNR